VVDLVRGRADSGDLAISPPGQGGRAVLREPLQEYAGVY
jgi:hypothetical protein